MNTKSSLDELTALRCELLDLSDEVKNIKHTVKEMAALLAPLKEEKKKKEAISRANAEIASAERIIEEAKKVIASGGEQEGYW